MKTILSLYEKSGNNKKPSSSYLNNDVATNKKSRLTGQAKLVGKSKFPDLTKLESGYDLDQYDKYLS